MHTKEKLLCILVHICQCHHCSFQIEFRHFPSIIIFEWMSQWLDRWMDDIVFSILIPLVWILTWYPSLPLGIMRNFLSPRNSLFFLINIFKNKSLFPLAYTSADNEQTHSTTLLIFLFLAASYLRDGSRGRVTGMEEIAILMFLKICCLVSLVLPNDLLIKEFS